MPALITGTIPTQGFELVRDRIGAILLLELTYQQTIQSLTEELNIFSERSVPADSSDELYINVLLGGAEYGQMTQKDAQGRTLFFIDIYTSAEETDMALGSFISAQRLQKYAGMCMYIFRSPYYKTMAGMAPKIGGTYVESLSLLDPHQKEDTDFTRFGRIQLAVRIQEDTEVWPGVPLEINNTTVKLDSTEKGYKFVFNNP